MYRAFCLLFALTLAPILGACCNFDKDTLEQEAAILPGILDTLAGKIERLPPAYYQNELRALEGVKESMTPLAYHLERARLLCQTAGYDEAWQNLTPEAGFVVHALDERQRPAAAELRALIALGQWFADRQAKPDRLQAVVAEMPCSPTHELLQKMARWAAESPVVKADEMMPDFLGLRFASNKTAIAGNDQLETMKLADAAPLLISLLHQWAFLENVDVLYALSLYEAVAGRQHLAHYTRLRISEMLSDSQTTRLPLSEGVSDIEPLLYARQLQLGRLVEIRTLDEPQKQHCAEEYAHRRAFARLWLAERGAFISKRLEAGRSPTEPDFWQGFIPPVMAVRQVEQPPANVAPGPTPVVEAANAPAPEPAPTRAVSSGAVAGAAAAAAMVLVITAAARRRRNRKPE